MVVAGAIVLGAVTIAACGGGGDDDSGSGSSVSSAPSGNDLPDVDVDGSAAGLVNEDCRQLAEAFDQSDVASSFTSGDDPTADLEATAEYLQEASDEVPEEISGDVETLAEVYADLADRAGDVDWEGIKSGNPAAAVSAAQLSGAFASSDFLTASQNLANFVRENCTG
jgi:hypothetical protein